MEMMRCPKCRADNSVRREACYNCGTILRPVAAEQHPDPQPPPAATPSPNSQAGPPDYATPTDPYTDIGRRRQRIALTVIGIAVGLPILISALASAPTAPPPPPPEITVTAPILPPPPPAPIPAAAPTPTPPPPLADADAQPGPSASLGQRLAWLRRHGPFLIALWDSDVGGYDSNPFVRPQAGNTFMVLRVAVGNVGYNNAAVNEFGFSYVAEDGVSYRSGFGLSPMVKRSLPSVSLADGAWTWGYMGFEVPKAALVGSVKCDGFFCQTICLPNIAKVRNALVEAGIGVPAGMMPDPSA